MGLNGLNCPFYPSDHRIELTAKNLPVILSDYFPSNGYVSIGSGSFMG